METRQDFVVGVLIVAAIAIVVGALIATSGWGERRYDLYLRIGSAEGISVDTRVIVQGLEVGRVRSISPRVDSMTRVISFVARLSIAERFADGSSLKLPVGSRGELVQVSQISPAVEVRLVPPDTLATGRLVLEAGDTINSVRKGSALEALTDVAGEMSREVRAVLRQAHRTLERVQGTLRNVDQTVTALRPDVNRALEYVVSTMGRVDSLVGRVQGTALPDSLSAAVAHSNQLLLRLDSLTTVANALATENQAAINGTVANLFQISRQLNHFVEEMSKRPYRLLTGVKPLSPDTIASPSRPADSAGGSRP
ncbi:MAG: hypothetical protein HYS40_06255 [Gemmatimonadetes bacterium]|nr:hypothetical protein [Gemmatimonadota bacterium]